MTFVNTSSHHLDISQCVLQDAPFVSMSPVAQYVERWHTNLAVPSSSIAGGGDFYSCKRGSIAHSLSLSPVYRSDMTEILLKRT